MPEEQLTYYLAFDHRGLFYRDLFGLDGPLTADETARVQDAKRLIYEGLVIAADRSSIPGTAALLVDEQFGTGIARDAAKRGFTVAMPVEKSDGAEFDFEFGDDFGAHVKDLDPTHAKVLVRYNPDGDRGLNDRQLERLLRLSEWLGSEGRSFLFELIVPPTETQLAVAGGDRVAYETDQRPALTLRAMREILDAGIWVDVWKLEGFDERPDAELAAELARQDGRDRVTLVLLGAGASEDRVIHWIENAAPVDGWVGFAIGRSIWKEPLASYLVGDLSRDEAAEEIARRYERFVDVWSKARTDDP